MISLLPFELLVFFALIVIRSVVLAFSKLQQQFYREKEIFKFLRTYELKFYFSQFSLSLCECKHLPFLPFSAVPFLLTSNTHRFSSSFFSFFVFSDLFSTFQSSTLSFSWQHVTNNAKPYLNRLSFHPSHSLLTFKRLLILLRADFPDLMSEDQATEFVVSDSRVGPPLNDRFLSACICTQNFFFSCSLRVISTSEIMN